MMQNPDVQENVQREIDDVIERARAPSMRDAVNMPYTQACIHEIQRVADIVPLGVPHSTSKEVMLKVSVFIFNHYDVRNETFTSIIIEKSTVYTYCN